MRASRHDSRGFSLPRSVLSASATIWGIVGGELWLGLALALLLQLPSILRWRLELEPAHYYRAADLTSVGFAVFTLYEFNARGLLGIYGILGSMPLCLAPLVLLAAYSERQAIPASALALSIRRRVRAGTAPEIWLDLGPAFVALCLLAASAGKVPAPWFDAIAFAGVIALLGAARPRRPALLGWLLTIACCGALGVGASALLVRVHAGLEDALQSWFSAHWYAPEFDRATTSIGRLGRLKLSDAVRLRIRTEGRLAAPLLIQEGSFQIFRFGTWSTDARRYDAVDAEPGGQSWRLAAQAPDAAQSLEIDVPQTRGIGVLPLPLGARRLTSTQIIEIRRNALGTVQVEAAPGQLRYRVETGEAVMTEGPPDPADLAVPNEYLPALDRVAHEIGLEAATREPAALARIQRFFAENFRYSVVQRGFFPGRMPLTDFLLRSRHGHCEYFASATVLLLRHAGIPARYAVGYGVDEYSRLEGAYVARARHAHAWALAWRDGRWVPVDTTPARWYELDADQASPLQLFSDLWSWAGFRLARARLSLQTLDTRLLLGTALGLAATLAWRLRGQLRRQREASAPQTMALPAIEELSPLFAALAARNLSPPAGETTAAWLRRLLPARIGEFELQRLIALYHRRRFRAGGLSSRELKELAALGRAFARAGGGAD